MVNISNEYANSSPIPESLLEAETRSAFSKNGEEINEGITLLLNRLSEKPEFKGYKLVVSATAINSETSGPVRTYTGAFWNPEQDGTWAYNIEPLNVLITITWIHI